jgi:hypothetical protein
MNVIAEKSLLSPIKTLARLLLQAGKSARFSERSTAFQLTAKRGLLLLYVILVSLVAWTWCSTADILIDFGRELYVPWQLLEGKSLYKDIAYFNGPLSPHFNALVFRLFGDSIVTLLVTNTIILVMLITTLYMLLLRYFSVVASTVACICMLVVFGVAHSTPDGNYNYITPYSHELTHGLLLAFAMLALLRHDDKFKLWKWSLIGVLWGLVFLGKAELFVATTAMLGGSLLLPLLGRKISIRQVILRVGTAAGFAALPIFAFWLLLCRETSPAEALLNLLGAWRYIFASEVSNLSFYRHLAGMTHPARNLLAIVVACTAIGSVLFGLYALERNIGGRGWGNPLAVGSLVLALCVSGCAAFLLHGRAFFVIAVALFLTLSWLAIRRRDDFPKYHHLACWAIFSVCVMSKIVFRSDLAYYGFALMMPVVVLAIVVAIDWLPRVMSRDGVGKNIRLALIALLLLDATVYLTKTVICIREKNCVIGSGPDRLRCIEKQGVPLKAATDYLASHMAPEERLLVLPEGISLNYLLRRETSSPHVNFMQPELVMYGEENIVSDLQRNPSDYVLIVSRRLDIYGLHHFGQEGYGDQIMAWIQANYVVEKQFGADPFVPGEFGVQVLRRRPEHTAAAERTNPSALATSNNGTR